MYVKFTETLSESWVKDKIVSLENDDVARAFIKAGQAVASNAEAAMEASFSARLESLKTELIQSRTAQPQPQNQERAVPPGSGGGVNFDHISAGTPAYEQGGKSFGDILRCIFVAGAQNVPHEMRSWATGRLDKHYGFAKQQYIQDAASGDWHAVSRAGTEGVSGGSTYGFLVKPEWYNSVFEISIEESVIEPDAFQVPIGNALELNWPALDQYQAPVAGQSSAYAGVQLYRKGEITQRTYSDAKLAQIQFKVTDLTGFTTLSRDLIVDNYIAADAVVQRLFGRAFAWKKDYEFLTGNGVGAPLGILNSPALLTTSRGTPSKILYNDLVGMLSQLHPSCWNDAFWVTNITTIPQLTALKDSSGAYVYQPNALISQAMTPAIMGQATTDKARKTMRPQGMMLGMPVKFTEKLPTLGNPADLILVSPSNYGIAARQGLEIGLSEHFLFDTDQIAFRFKLRNDGQPLWRSYYQQADGSNTKVSPFIQLV